MAKSNARARWKCLKLIFGVTCLMGAFNNCSQPMQSMESGAVLSSDGEGRPPLILQQPASASVTAGASVTFTVTVSDDSGATYQWNKNGTIISGASGSSYTIANVALSDAGNFNVIITNSSGAAVSQTATLTVNASTPVLVAPTITSQPVARTVTVGSAASFSVAASGSATLTYQWMKNGANLSGATSSTYSIASAQIADAGQYAVRVSNGAGAVTSNAAALTVNSPPVMNAEFPNSTNTGYRNAPGYPGSLTTFTGTITSNTTYKFMKFTDGLYIKPGISNVTFFGCQFTSNSVSNANVTIGDYNDSTVNNIVFDYSSFEPKAVSAPPVAYNKGYQYGINQRSSAGVTIDHSDFWGWGNGIQFGYSTQDRPFVVKNSWFHDARDDGGIDHTDAILSNEGGPSYMIFDHNTIASRGNTQGLALQTEKRGYDQVVITNNYFSGFGYTVAIGENLKSTNITFTGNTFGTDFKPVFGTLYSDADYGSSGNVWKCNRWLVVPGSYYKPVSDDGKFWVPGGVSASDYLGNKICP